MILIMALMVSACNKRGLMITDFSTTIKLDISTKKKSVIGLVLTTELDATGPITLNIGCHGNIFSHVTIPANHHFSQRIDWYDNCAEISFDVGASHARSIYIEHDLQTLNY